MAALTASRATVQVGDHGVIELVQFPIKAATKIYAGALVVSDAGYAAPGRTATGLKALGILWRVHTSVNAAVTPALTLTGDADNTSGANAAFNIDYRRGTFKFINDAGDPVAQADLPCSVYITDDQTVCKTATGKSLAGTALFIDTDGQVAVEVGNLSLKGV